MPVLLLGPLLRYVGTTDATIWVEVDQACRVSVLGTHQPTFEVAGHHYALVGVEGLAVGSQTEYAVELNGVQVWPPPGGALPPPRIRTLDPARAQRIVFGSCRCAPPESTKAERRLGVDALRALALRTADHSLDTWPDLLLMLGDQVYADETTTGTQARIMQRRILAEPPGTEVADFEEYTWLYHEAWTDPDVRWLMSTVPTAMIFDDHDVHDDWNTSRAWRDGANATPWWPERIIGALMSYWVYQHLGNLSPAELAADPVHAQVRAAVGDAAPVLRAFAVAADREADGAKGYRWSFRRDLGRTRLVVIDSRCGRMLDGDHRSMVSDPEFDWIEQQLEGDYDHLLLGTSVPWLMPPAFHALESWSEQLAGDRRPRVAALGEKLRQSGDLEHWPAFLASFERLARIVAEVGAGRRTTVAPASICVLSGDVHHSYVSRADLPSPPGADAVTSPVYQLTCSPIRNRVPSTLRAALLIMWSAPVGLALRLLLTHGRVRRPTLSWRTVDGPFFGNAISTVTLEGRHARLVMEVSRTDNGIDSLRPVVDRSLST